MPTMAASCRRPMAHAFHGQEAALVVGEAEPSGSVSGAEDPILLKQVFNNSCCCRLTQPAKIRTTKATGAGSESMAEACARV